MLHLLIKVMLVMRFDMKGTFCNSRDYLIRVRPGVPWLTGYLTYNLLLLLLWLQEDFLQPNKDPQWAALQDRISSLKYSGLSHVCDERGWSSLV